MILELVCAMIKLTEQMFLESGWIYEIPLENGDIGAALHNVKLDVKASRDADGKWTAKVKVRDDFDFTELKNPFNQGSIKKGFLWAANDLALIDSKLGMLDPVGVEITYTKKY